MFTQIFILDRIECQILFALAKLTESKMNIIHAVKYIRIVQDIQIFSNNLLCQNEGLTEILKKFVFCENAECFNDYQPKMKLS